MTTKAAKTKFGQAEQDGLESRKAKAVLAYGKATEA